MKLSEQHIQELYTFTRKHYVEHYDLQTELVDHLANGIEQHIAENPKLTFEEALDLEFKKFGIFGFNDVVEDRQKSLTKHYYGNIWKLFVGFFKLPKVVVTLLAIIVLYQILYYVPYKEFVFIGFFILSSPFYIYKLRSLQKYTKTRIKETNKRWMYEEIVFQMGGGSFGLTLIPQLLLHGDKLNNVVWPSMFIAVAATIMVVFTLYSYIVLVLLPKSATAYLSKMYPEYQIA